VWPLGNTRRNLSQHVNEHMRPNHKSTFTKTKKVICGILGRVLDIDDILSVNENHNGTGSVSTKDLICFYYIYFCSEGIFDRPTDLYRRGSLPMNLTPRIRRISKQFGLIDDRVLNFRDSEDTKILSIFILHFQRRQHHDPSKKVLLHIKVS
jgi:hypothetical protein